MITQGNITQVLNVIPKSHIAQVLEDNHDYILLELHIFNSGSTASLKGLEYDEITKQEASNNGQLFCDIDSFKDLVEASESTNKYLIESFTL